MRWRLFLAALRRRGFVLSNFSRKDGATPEFDVYANVNIL
jgi:hypothetical protein